MELLRAEERQLQLDTIAVNAVSGHEWMPGLRDFDEVLWYQVALPQKLL